MSYNRGVIGGIRGVQWDGGGLDRGGGEGGEVVVKESRGKRDRGVAEGAGGGGGWSLTGEGLGIGSRSMLLRTLPEEGARSGLGCVRSINTSVVANQTFGVVASSLGRRTIWA